MDLIQINTRGEPGGVITGEEREGMEGKERKEWKERKERRERKKATFV